MCITEERRELNQVDAVYPVVIVGIPATPAHAAVARCRLGHGTRRRRIARMPGQGLADEAFEAAFGGVGGHSIKYPSTMAYYDEIMLNNR